MNQLLHFFSNLLNAEGFPPRWFCGEWTFFHGWLYVIADLLIWGAYMSIPMILLFFIKRRSDLPFPRIFWLFAIFIFACGSTHLLDAVMFWWPAYRLSALVYLITGIVSWVTVFALIPVLPQALSLKSPGQLETEVQARTAELAERSRELEAANETITTKNQQLSAYAAKLELSNRELEQFAAITSHDLQEPLRKLMMFSDYVHQATVGKLDEQTLEYVRRMHKTSYHMRNLITDLLDLSRVNRKGQPFSPTNLKQVVEEVLADLQITIAACGGRVAVGEMMTIDADKTQMHQLFQNLISNGLKFYPAGGPPPVVHVSAVSVGSGECEIRVSDEGIGLDAAYRDQIFNIFERLNGEEYAGTGIGLSICQRIVERHQGSIRVESMPGTGATFIIRLPVRHIEASSTAQPR